MTAPVQFGQIVWAELADANGVRKLRPAVIVTPDDRITPSGPLEAAITSLLPQPLPQNHVLLPWHPRGHPRTGLNRKCAAVCNWLGRILPTDICSVAGSAPGSVLLEIVSKIPPVPPPSAAPPSPETSASGGGAQAASED